MQQLNTITYGNPSIDQVNTFSKESMFSDLFSKFSKVDFPENSSPATKDELMQIINCMNSLIQDQKVYDRYIAYDRNILQFIALRFPKENYEDIITIIEKVNQDILPLILQLKYHFQRPRPYQLAEYYKIKLFPERSFSSLSPSYPSAAVIQTAVMIRVLENKYPDPSRINDSIIDDVANSRIYQGHNYPSDVDISLQIADEILIHPAFIDKYNL